MEYITWRYKLVTLSSWKIKLTVGLGERCKTVRVEEQKYDNFHIMIVQVVLVIVTAVQVNSQQLCHSVCQCYSDWATCINVFSDVTTMTQQS